MPRTPRIGRPQGKTAELVRRLVGSFCAKINKMCDNNVGFRQLSHQHHDYHLHLRRGFLRLDVCGGPDYHHGA